MKQLPKLIKDWPPEWQEAFDERWAIMNIDGEIEKGKAKGLAEVSTRRAFMESQWRVWIFKCVNCHAVQKTYDRNDIPMCMTCRRLMSCDDE